MFRIHKNKDNPYVMINKNTTDDRKISWKARGILCYLLGLPDDWQIYETELVKHSEPDGISSLRSGIKELMKKGYIERVKLRNEKGQFVGYEYSVYEVPTVFRKTEDGKAKIGKSNTTNKNLTNKTPNQYLRLLNESKDEYVLFYLKALEQYGKKQKRVSLDNFDKIEKSIEVLVGEDVSLEIWKNAVHEHLKGLPKSNDGDILAFLKASMWYFEVDLEGRV